MFELSIALKYLIPKKKHLSVTIIAMMSVTVISLVVWLLLVFLSVTEGMEKTWLKKLTDLNAPIRITPTPAYFSSYYYKVDSLSNASSFSLKTLEEKLKTVSADPYDPEEDPEIPAYWAKADLNTQGTLVDPVKGLSEILSKLKTKEKSLIFQDYEMSGATLKLQLLRNRSPSPFSQGQESLNFLTQVSYLSTPPSHPKTLSTLLAPISLKDINHLFFLAGYRMENTLSDNHPDVRLSTQEFQKKITHLLQCIQIKTVKTISPDFKLPLDFLPKGPSFVVYGLFRNGDLVDLILPKDLSSKPQIHLPEGISLEKGSLQKGPNEATLTFKQETLYIPLDTYLNLETPIIFSSKTEEESVKTATEIKDIKLLLKGSIQGHPVEGLLKWQHLAIETFTLDNSFSPPWVYEKSQTEMVLPVGSSQEKGILLPKTFQDNGVLLGDKGFLSYSSSTASAIQEQRTAVFVAGFYDPGILSVGSKCLLVPRSVTRTINSSNTSFTFDKIALNGFQVWFEDPSKVSFIKKQIETSLGNAGLLPYWQVVSFEEYDFAKDLLEQFQSDKYLFSLVGIIILLVACCNIFSFLILLVNDKKKEIAILQAMGASKKSITCIFGVSGVVIGLLGSILGISAAILTLSNIDTLVKILSMLQGHDAFHQSFYGASLPGTLSSHALLFICISTPIFSLLAGLIPALKACRLHPSSILRSDS